MSLFQGVSWDAAEAWRLGVIAGLAVVTVITRAFFLIFNRPWRLPQWLHQALPYAPIAALAAVLLPDMLLRHGEWVLTASDARWYAALAAAAVYFWRRNVLHCIVLGMAIYLPLHLAWGW
jgi:branched-subunit amino acid transport protein